MKVLSRLFTLFFSVALLGLSTPLWADDNSQSDNGRPPHPPRMQLTDAQKSCLEGKLGKPGSIPRPAREAVEAAFKECKIPKPTKPPTQQPPSGE